MLFSIKPPHFFLPDFSLRATMSSTEQPEHRKQEAEEETTGGAADDEDTGAEVAPIVKLQEVAVTTGEEDETVLLDLYVFFLLNIFAWIPRKLDNEIGALNFILFFNFYFGSRESEFLVQLNSRKYSGLIFF